MRVPVKLTSKDYRELRGRAFLKDRTFEEFIRDILFEWQMNKAENRAAASTDVAVTRWLPIERKVLAEVRGVAKGLGMSTKQAIVEACSEMIAWYRKKEAAAAIPDAAVDAVSGPEPAVLGPAMAAAASVPASPAGDALCQRCGNTWARKTANPACCPKCRSRSWNDTWACVGCGGWIKEDLRKGSYCRFHTGAPAEPA
jgi:hypothetical protein